MKFPSLAFVQSLQESLNGNDKFFVASKWSDVKVLLCFGEQRYWMKLYGGKVIDVMEYFPMANPLGWDYMVSGSLATWNALRQGTRVVGHLLDSGDIMVDGNLLQANRMYESTHLTLMTIRDLQAVD